MVDVTAAPAPAPPVASARRGSGRRASSVIGTVPFFGYVTVFLLIPTGIVVVGAFVSPAGGFTFGNVTALGSPAVLDAFVSSVVLSAVTAVIGAVFGGLLSYVLVTGKPGSLARRIVTAACSVLAQFGGVMLAFAFISTIGIQGVITVLLKDAFGINIFAEGNWIYEVPGLLLPYIYFQVPLMVITFMPALAALKPQWAEANATLGGTRRSFWMQIGFPVLAPSFLASLLLLFANAFSSYATAAALISQGSQIVPLQIRAALTSETVLGRENLAGALALGMIIVVGVVMAVYSLIQRRAARWQA